MSETLVITFGGLTFEGITKFGNFSPPGGPCLYVILFKPKPETNPLDFKVLYFGDHEHLDSQEFYANHPKLRCWISEGGRLDALYVGTYAMPESNSVDRKQKLMDLLDVFRPVCNI